MLFGKRKKHYEDRHNVIVVGKPGYENVTESFNRLKDNILYFNVDKKTNVILLSSATSREGKTTIITNLAVSLGLNDKKVVIVDCDLRAPKVHRPFEVSNDLGISNYMLENLSLEDVVTKTAYENVDLICRGPKIENPSAVITSNKFKELIYTLKEQYDYVLVDCSPILEISDYIHISTVTDGIIYAVAYGRTKKSQVKEAISLVKQSRIKILGIVYTMYDNKLRKNDGYYLTYGKYYSHEEHHE